MATVFSNDVWAFSFRSTVSGRPHYNVTHIQMGTFGLTGDQDDKIEQIVASYQRNILEFLTDNVVFQGCDFFDMKPGGGRSGSVPPIVGWNTQGKQQTNAAPPNVCYLIHKVTNDRPRGRSDGRMYLSGVHEGEVDNGGNITPGWRGIVQPYLDQWFADVDSGTLDPTVEVRFKVLETTEASREKGDAPVTIGNRKVTSLRLDPKVATQRRRLRG